MDLTKETLHLVDAILEHLRAELLSQLMFGAELKTQPKIGVYDARDEIHEELRPAVYAVAGALATALAAGDEEKVVQELVGDAPFYFVDEQGDVRLTDFDDVLVAWRPMPPGQPYRLLHRPPEEIDLPPLGELPIQ